MGVGRRKIRHSNKGVWRSQVFHFQVELPEHVECRLDVLSIRADKSFPVIEALDPRGSSRATKIKQDPGSHSPDVGDPAKDLNLQSL